MSVEILTDAYPIRGLFEEVFKTPISKELLDWKYAGGRGYNIVFLDSDNTITGHAGAIFRDVINRGEKIKAPQMADLMVSSKRQSGLSTKTSPFYQICDKYISILTTEQNKNGLTFGFPSKRAMSAGKKMGLFVSVELIYELRFGKMTKKIGSPSAIPIKTGDMRGVVDRFWEYMRRDFCEEILGSRDFEYINYRYLQRPEISYGYYAIRSGWLKRLIGFVVIREFEDALEIMDIVCEKKRMRECIIALQSVSANDKNLRVWLVERYAKKFEKYASAVVKTEFEILANPIGADRIRNSWWLTSGDTEYR